MNDAWKGYFIQPNELEEIRKLWGTYTAPRIPREAEDSIGAIVARHGQVLVSPAHTEGGVEKPNEQLDAKKSEPEH